MEIKTKMTSQYPEFKFLNEKETKKLLNELEEQFGINEVEGIFVQRGAERIFLYQGDFSEEEIKEMENSRIVLERVGIYFGKKVNYNEEEIRLSIDGIQIVKDKITKNIFELNAEQAQEWMEGKELNIETNLRGFIVLKYNTDFIGCGKASENKITNFIPKNRRLKEKN